MKANYPALFVVIALAIVTGLFADRWYRNKSGNEKLEGLLLQIKTELLTGRKAISKTVESHIKVKESAVRLLDRLPDLRSEADLEEFDRLDLLMRRNFHLVLPFDYYKALTGSGELLNMGNDSLAKMIINWPFVLEKYLSEERQSESFYYREFTPFLRDKLPIYGRAEAKSRLKLYRLPEYANLVNEKMELVIHILYQGQIVKNYTDELIRKLDAEIARGQE